MKRPNVVILSRERDDISVGLIVTLRCLHLRVQQFIDSRLALLTTEQLDAILIIDESILVDSPGLFRTIDSSPKLEPTPMIILHEPGSTLIDVKALHMNYGLERILVVPKPARTELLLKAVQQLNSDDEDI